MDFLILIIIGVVIFAIWYCCSDSGLEAGVKIEEKLEGRKREKIKQDNLELERIRKEEQKKIDEKILNSEGFQYQLSYLRPYWRWMTLAGGIDPWLHPIIKFSNDGMFEYITLEKEGYDLWREPIDTYKNGDTWEEREEALERFAKYLFGEYAEEMKEIISIEYIADDLIKLEPYTVSSYNFTLTYTTRFWNKGGLREKELFIRELQDTAIIQK